MREEREEKKDFFSSISWSRMFFDDLPTEHTKNEVEHEK
jgi:hypothetical protein